MYTKPTIAKLFDIQYKEVADVAQQIEKLARKLSQAASQEDSPNDNDIYGYSTDIVVYNNRKVYQIIIEK